MDLFFPVVQVDVGQQQTKYIYSEPGVLPTTPQALFLLITLINLLADLLHTHIDLVDQIC